MRHIQINKGGSIYTRTMQILAYADDVNLIGTSTGRLNDGVVQMEEGANKVGLRINEDKTKYMKIQEIKYVLGMRNIYKYVVVV